MNILSAIRVLVYIKLRKLKADYPAVCVMYQLSFVLFLSFFFLSCMVHVFRVFSSFTFSQQHTFLKH